MAGKGRPKNSRDVAPKIRHIVDKALETIGIQGCVKLLVEEIQERKSLDPITKYAVFFPKEVVADVNSTVSIEDFVTGTVSNQLADDSPAEDHIH